MSQLTLFLALVLTAIVATGQPQYRDDSSHLRGGRQMWRGEQGRGSISRVSHAGPNKRFTSRQNAATGSQQPQNPKPPASICQAAGFFSNPGSCTGFHRCVDWTGRGTRFSIFHFTCPTGTIFDDSLGICNHPWAVAKPECTGYQEPLVVVTNPTPTPPTRPITQTRPITIWTPPPTKPTQPPTLPTQLPTVRPIIEVSSEKSGSTQTPVNGNSNPEGFRPDNSTQTGVSENGTSSQTGSSVTDIGSTQTEDPIKGEGSSQTEIHTGGSPQTETQTGSSIQTDSSSQAITSLPDITSAPAESIQSGDGETDETSQTSLPDSIVSVQTVTPPTDTSSQTNSPSQSESSSQTDSSSSQTDTSSQTVSSLQTENPIESDFTTIIPSSSSSSNTSTVSPSSTLIPQNNSGISNFPPKPFTLECKPDNTYRRHPLYCNRYYYCTWDSAAADWIFPSFTCPLDLLFDEISQQCSSTTAPCDGILAPTDPVISFTKPTSVTPLTPTEAPETTGLDFENTTTEKTWEVDPISTYSCPAPGYYPFEGDCIRFYKCVETEEGKLKGLLYRCPNGYGYNEEVMRCRKESELPKCTRVMTEALFRVEAARPLYIEDLKWFFLN